MFYAGVFFIFFGVWLAFGWLATVVGDPERTVLNAFLGILFGPFGVLIAAVVGINRKEA